MSSEENIHRLEGTNTAGGLVIRKKKKEGGDTPSSLAPPPLTPSRLGLDALAKQRREQKDKEELFNKRRKVEQVKGEVLNLLRVQQCIT